MDLKPNAIGPKVLYINPVLDKLTTANIAAIDTAYSDVISPYAYSATVRDDYDAYNFWTDDAGSSLALGQRIAVGLFLSPQNDKQSFVFQLSGSAKFYTAGTTDIVAGKFFFGRKATNNTVVSDKTAVQNTLAKFMLLPSTSAGPYNGTGVRFVDEAITTELFALNLVGGFVYCFGFMMDNFSAANACNLIGGVSLSMRKYTSVIPAHSPEL